MGSQTSRDNVKIMENQTNGDDTNGGMCIGNSEEKVREIT